MINVQVQHVYPLNDLKPHVIACVYNVYEDHITCPCSCEPRIERTQDGRITIVTHSSFDGREGVEWANEILNQTNNRL